MELNELVPKMLLAMVLVSIIQNFAFHENPPLKYAHPPLLVKHKKKFPSVFGGHPMYIHEYPL
jgi:hypothetical protein